MSFLSPERLLLLAAVLGLAGLYAALQFKNRRYAVRFTNLDLLASVAPKRPGWRRHVTALGFVTALTCMVVAFAQPARAVQVPRERATVVLAIDTSLSMMATDVSPDRFTAAQEAAKEFVELLPDTINLGLVSFDGAAVMRVQPTLDHQQVSTAIDDLEMHQQTAIGDAIRASLAAIELVPPDAEGTPPPAAIVLLSDGETSVGTPNDIAVAEAIEAEIPVSTIAFGTPDGWVEVPGEPAPINVPVNEEALNDIATETGGAAFSAATSEELKAVYDDIGSSVGYEEEDKEVTAWFVGLGLVLLTATAAGSLTWFSRLP